MPDCPALQYQVTARALTPRTSEPKAPSVSVALEATDGPARQVQETARALTPRRQSFQPQTQLPEVPTLENPFTAEEKSAATPFGAHQRLFSDTQRQLLYTLSVADERLHVVGVAAVLLNACVVLRWPQHYWALYLTQVTQV
jgi:hypothetical protein